MGKKQSKSHWQKDEEAPACGQCGQPFSLLVRRHHCRNCGWVYCGNCTRHRAPIPRRGIHEPERVCDSCYPALRTSPGGEDVASRGGPGSSVDRGALNDGAAPSSSGGPNTLVSDGTVGAAPSDITSQLSPLEQRAVVDYEGEYRESRDAAATAPEGREEGASTVLEEDEEAEEEDVFTQRCNVIRRNTVYIDVSLQQSERVEPDTMVNYSRATESLTLELELSWSKLSESVLPLPHPCTDSARYLLQPVPPVRLPPKRFERLIVDLKEQLVVSKHDARTAARPTAADFVGY